MLLNKLFDGLNKDVKMLAKNFIKNEKFSKKKKLKFTVITHNCSGYFPDLEKDIEAVHYPNIVEEYQSDIVIIGLQEIVEMKTHNL